MTNDGFSPFYPTKKHVQRLARVLATAFMDNPIYRAMIPSDVKRNGRLHVLFEFMVTYTLKYGILVATSEALEGAMLALDWEKGRISPWRMLRCGALRILFSFGFDFMRRQSIIGKVLDEMHVALPPAMHTYLWNIAVDPVHQGKGFGGTLIRYLQSILSEQHRPCYLETAKPENVELYKYLGFRVAGTRYIDSMGITATGMLWEG
ncbi:MAG TPA: GNAT family N-acetyltransferase [Candidatus Lokiarchaeia archaeon]|nr:GNAT family N-acetyltransferase [Candidatus Lokiarchaeia archaeon]